jgi:predicted phage-related endonuclease
MPTPINISASRGAAILGLSKWKTPVQTWLEIMEARESGFCEKNNYKLPEFEEGPPLRWGKAFESAIVELAESIRNSKIVDREKLYKLGDDITDGDKWDFITCHIDGAYLKPEGKLVFPLHEGKTTSLFYFNDNFGEPGTDKVPIEYQIQCQHQMICTGAEKVILSVLVFPRRVEEWEEMGIRVAMGMIKEDGHQFAHIRKIIKTDENGLHTYRENFDGVYQWADMLNQMGYFHQYEIKAHKSLQKIMIKHYADFWEKNIIGKKEPTPQTYDDIKCLVREPSGTIVADENIERLAIEYRDIKSEISGTGPLAKKTQQIKVMLLDYMREQESTLDDDTTDKWIMRNRQGQKIASYGKDKNGKFIFR